MGKVTHLLDATQFRSGLAAGLICAAVAMALIACIPLKYRRTDIAGWVPLLGGIAALQGVGPWKPAHPLGGLALAGIAGLAVGGEIARTLGKRAPVGFVGHLMLFAPGGAPEGGLPVGQRVSSRGRILLSDGG